MRGSVVEATCLGSLYDPASSRSHCEEGLRSSAQSIAKLTPEAFARLYHVMLIAEASMMRWSKHVMG